MDGKVKPEDIKVDENTEQPPEGYTQDEWDGLSAAEKEGILDGINHPEGGEAPEEELSDDDKKTLENIAGEGDDDPEKKKKEEEDTEKKRLEDKAKAEGKTVDEIIAIEAEEKKNVVQPDAIAEEALLNYRPVLTKEEMVVVEEKPEEIPENISKQLADLDQKYDEGEIKLSEYNAERDKLNRQIIRHNDKINETARAEAETQNDEKRWQKTQQYFLSAKPEYVPAKTDDAAEKVKRNALFGALCEMVKSISSDPANAHLTDMQLLIKADKQVKEAFGIKPEVKPPEKKKDEKKPPAKIPDHKTLGDAPPAGDNNDGVDDSFAQIDKLTGEAYEQALERMSPAVKEAYLNRA